jgi:scyllo-inositol 2-dehydrogenase (NADP+)
MNLATIGTSWITSSFIGATKKSKKLSLHSIFSRSIDKSKEFAYNHNALHYYTNLEEMLKNPEIDVVYIGSPNSLHYEQAIKCIGAKKHVICEKPIFSNTKELLSAFQFAEENGVYLFEAIRNIHSPNFAQLRDELKGIGKIRSAALNYLQYSSRYDAFLNNEEPNVFSPTFSGGALVDLGVYPLFIAAALFGKPNDIHYFPVKLRNGIDGNGTLILQYSDFNCTIMCSKISQSYVPSEIHGENGTIVLDKVAPITNLEFIENRSKTSTPFAKDQDENDMIYEIDNFVRIIQSKNYKEYEVLKNLSHIVLSITETARQQNGIVFGVEKSSC